jgi:hypothetical protein
VTRSILACLSVAFAAPLAAQAGYPPDRSPYRDIRTSTTIEAYGGNIFGSGGPIPVGPRDGPMAGVRFMLRAKNTLSLGLGIWGAKTVRSIVDADAVVEDRVTGPIDHGLYGAELMIQFNLTGGKSWHGLAPYVGVGLGVVKGQSTPAVDTSRYEFGTKFYFSPVVGTRLMLGSRAYFKFEGRALVWKLKYPVAYDDEPALDPGTPEAPNAVNPSRRSGQYIMAPALAIGFGWAF